MVDYWTFHINYYMLNIRIYYLLLFTDLKKLLVIDSLINIEYLLLITHYWLFDTN
jgi:hypothetical protein